MDISPNTGDGKNHFIDKAGHQLSGRKTSSGEDVKKNSDISEETREAFKDKVSISVTGMGLILEKIHSDL